MSPSDLAWLKYPLATVTLVAVLALLGLPAWTVVRRRLPAWSAMLVPLLGMAWVMILVSWYAKLGTALHSWLVRGAVAAAVVFALAWALRSDALGAFRRRAPGAAVSAASAAWGSLLPWLVGVSAVTAFMIPVTTTPFEPMGFLTVFTFGNADVGSYVAQASNVLHAGFADAGMFFGWDPGSNELTFSADQDHTGANGLLAFNAALFGSEVWKLAQVTLMAACAALVVGATALARAFLPRRPRVALAVAAFATSTVMVWYLVGNFFLAHILCLALIMAQLAILVLAREHLLDWRILATLAPLAAATWLSSPELQLVFILLAGALIGADFVSSVIVRVEGALSRLWRAALGVGLALVGSAVLILPFMTANVARSQRVYNTKTAVGWAFDVQNGVIALFGYPNAFGGRSDLGWIAILVVGIGLTACVGWVLYRRDRIGILAAAFGLVMVAASVFGALRWNFSGYQSWKLILTLSVPFLLFAALLLLRTFTSASNRHALVAVLAALMAVNVVVGSRMWDQARSSEAALRYASVGSELATFMEDRRVREQDRLNIYLPSMYGTMIAPTMFGKRAAMSSTTYYSGAMPNAKPYACSLVDASMYKKRMGKVVYANHGYLLVATPKCD